SVGIVAASPCVGANLPDRAKQPNSIRNWPGFDLSPDPATIAQATIGHPITQPKTLSLRYE
ncbi:MAG: hypothetical protein VZR37_01390, partial [Bifidobacterium merycicum]|nr:hypothetical protein [Bifidobacterium merycicum]